MTVCLLFLFVVVKSLCVVTSGSLLVLCFVLMSSLVGCYGLVTCLLFVCFSVAFS